MRTQSSLLCCLTVTGVLIIGMSPTPILAKHTFCTNPSLGSAMGMALHDYAL